MRKDEITFQTVLATKSIVTMSACRLSSLHIDLKCRAFVSQTIEYVVSLVSREPFYNSSMVRPLPLSSSLPKLVVTGRNFTTEPVSPACDA